MNNFPKIRVTCSYLQLHTWKILLYYTYIILNSNKYFPRNSTDINLNKNISLKIKLFQKVSFFSIFFFSRTSPKRIFYYPFLTIFSFHFWLNFDVLGGSKRKKGKFWSDISMTLKTLEFDNIYKMKKWNKIGNKLAFHFQFSFLLVFLFAESD